MILETNQIKDNINMIEDELKIIETKISLEKKK